MKEKIEKKLMALKGMIRKKSNEADELYKYKGINYKSRKYNLALVIILLGYLFFFTSNSLFNSEGDIMSTPFNKEIALSNYKIIMKNATYSNENRVLEVNFSIEKTSVTLSSELILEAKERNNPAKKLDTNMINLNGKDYTIIVKLPEEWTTVLLQFTEDNEFKTSTKFYVDRRESIEEKSLEEKTRKDYLIQTVDEEIENVNKKIEENNNQIKEKDKEINQLKNEIDRLEIERKYLTESELIDMSTKIDSLYSQKLEAEKAILQCEQSIKELNGKIEKLKLKKSDFQNLID